MHANKTIGGTKPATRWLEALPLGNGRIGAMVWGDPLHARFSLNESTLWSGFPGATAAWQISAEKAEHIRQRSRELFEAGRVRDAQEEIEKLGAAWSQAYQPVGELTVELAGPSVSTGGPAAGSAGQDESLYRRELHFERGEHTVSTSSGKARTFISSVDEVLVHAFPCPAASEVQLGFSSPLIEVERTADFGGLSVVLRAPSDGVPSRHSDVAQLDWEGEGASRAAVVVRTSQSGERRLVVCAIVTTWRGMGMRPDRAVSDALAEATAQAESALIRGEEELRHRHFSNPLAGVSDVDLCLEGSSSASELLDTTFAYGRYLLACSSRPGLPPANLQGIWNEQVLAPWSSNYTVNINLEMNHWAAGISNIPDAAEALERYVAMLRTTGRETARRLYGAQGWVVHHNSDPWGYSDPVRGNPKWSTWPLGGLWLERELDSIAEFSGDSRTAIAERRLPALRDAALFALDLLHGRADGELVTFPSTSPENEWLTADGDVVSLSEGAGMDRWLIREVLESLVDKARLLGCNDELVRRAIAALTRVPGPKIGADGRILEWHLDGAKEADPSHRHVSHLAFLYPGTREVDPDVLSGAAASLEARGDEATGWSLVWKACLWARLYRPDRVQVLLEMFLRAAETGDGTERAGLYPNLFSAHPPFQVDGNIGIVAAISECLVQSHRGKIELLPALPQLMASGSIRGIRARPGIEVEMSWTGGRLATLALRAMGPGAVGAHTVRCGQDEIEVDLAEGATVQVDVSALQSPVLARLDTSP